MLMREIIGAIGALGFGIATAQADLINIPDPVSNNSSLTGWNDYIQYFSGSATYATAFDNVTFSTTPSIGNSALYDIGSQFPGVSCPGNGTSCGLLTAEAQSTGSANILITFSRPVDSVSVTYGTTGGPHSGIVSFTIDGDTIDQVVSPVAGGYAATDLFSYISPSAFTSIEMTAPKAGALDIGKLYFAKPIPEPSTWALLLVGFAGLGWAKRRRQKRSAANRRPELIFSGAIRDGGDRRTAVFFMRAGSR